MSSKTDIRKREAFHKVGTTAQPQVVSIEFAKRGRSRKHDNH